MEQTVVDFCANFSIMQQCMNGEIFKASTDMSAEKSVQNCQVTS